jgi:hypothetical protein
MLAEITAIDPAAATLQRLEQIEPELAAQRRQCHARYRRLCSKVEGK